MDLFGWPTLDSKKTTSLTLPRAMSREPSETAPPDRADSNPRLGAKADFPFRSSIKTFRPTMPEMDRRISDMNSPSTVVGEPHTTMYRIPRSGMTARISEISSTIRLSQWRPARDQAYGRQSSRKPSILAGHQDQLLQGNRNHAHWSRQSPISFRPSRRLCSNSRTRWRVCSNSWMSAHTSACQCSSWTAISPQVEQRVCNLRTTGPLGD